MNLESNQIILHTYLHLKHLKLLSLVDKIQQEKNEIDKTIET